MATRYLHDFAASTVALGLQKANLTTPDKPNAFGLFAVNGVIYPGKDSASTPTNVNLEFRTQVLSKTIKLNSQTDSDTVSGELIGFQSKPRTGVAGTQSVYGCQISAQISDGIALTGSGSIIGGHVDVYVRGTSAGTIAGDVRGLQIELTTDDAGTRDITGYVTGIRIRKVFSAGTVTGVQSAIRVEVPEVQTNSETYTGLFDLTGTVGTGTTTVWTDGAVTSATAAGVLGIYVNGSKRYINLYSGTPA